jgi:hypothetical protein
VKLKLLLLRRMILLPRPRMVSNVLTITGLAAFVAFGATFGLRWALLAAVPALFVLGAAAGS